VISRRSEVSHLLLALASIALVTLIYTRWLPVSSAATVSTTFLLVVLIVAATSRLRVAVITSLASMVLFNFFFLPPLGTLTIADPQNWIALFAFLTVSLIASNLSAVARARTEEAVGRRDEMARLFDLSRDVLVITDSRQALSVLARTIARRFDLEFVAIALPRADQWELFSAGARTMDLDPRELTHAFAAARTSFEFDAQARTYAGHRTMLVGADSVRLVPLRVGTRPIGLLAAMGRPIEPGTLDALAGVVAIAIERTQFLEERKTAELTRQSEDLKASLLASLGHDLRTPLTAIRVAAGNIKTAALSTEARAEQSDVILTEAERLTRLFENILEMARIDAGAVPTDSRWVHPSEIIATAQGQVEQTLRQHTLSVDVAPDLPVRLDPRLTAAALARVLENAAQYSPPGSIIHVGAAATSSGLEIQVRDHGPGLASSDLPNLFQRFARGAAAKRRTSGTGLGLSIARGLLAAEGGRIWAENDSEGGSRFTIAVPAAVKASEAAAHSSE